MARTRTRPSHPRFTDVSDRQLTEALLVIQRELDARTVNEDLDTMTVDDLRILTSYRTNATLEYVRSRLPSLLGFR